MSVPKSVVKLSKDGVTYTSSVDTACYTIRELTRAALRDVGRYIARVSADNARSELRGFRRGFRGRSHRRVFGKLSASKLSPAFQFFVRKNELDLQVGIRADTWYGVEQELGTSRMPKKGILRNATYDNIRTIIEIESQYLSALNQSAVPEELLSEEEAHGGGEG